MLRGYTPLKEIYQWRLLLATILLILSPAPYLLSPQYDNLNFLTFGLFWPLLLVLAFPLIFGPLYLFQLIGYNRERRRTESLQREVLRGNFQKFVPVPSSADQGLLSLPCRVQSRIKRSFVILVAILVGVIGIWLGAEVIVMLADPADLSPWSSWTPILSAFTVMLLWIGPYLWRLLSAFIVDYHLRPSFEIDEDGITARYGHNIVTMRWMDVRYFALANGKRLLARGVATSTTKSGTNIFIRRNSVTAIGGPVEVFELCDGENTICWSASELIGSACQLWRSGDTLLAPQDYDAFTQRLSSLIVSKTGCQLYDLRQEQKKKKVKSAPSQGVVAPPMTW